MKNMFGLKIEFLRELKKEIEEFCNSRLCGVTEELEIDQAHMEIRFYLQDRVCAALDRGCTRSDLIRYAEIPAEFLDWYC